MKVFKLFSTSILGLTVSLTLAAIVVQGCSHPKTKDEESQGLADNPGEATGFKSTSIAVPAPTEADVETDLLNLGVQRDPKTIEALYNASRTKAAKELEEQRKLASEKGTQNPKDKVDAPEDPATDAAGKKKKGRRPAKGSMNYYVLAGDTLMKISFKAFADPLRWKEIMEDNAGKIKNPNLLAKGAVLRLRTSEYAVIIKNGQPYLIRRKDTLAKIADGVYGSASLWPKIWKNNPQLIRNPNKIYAGFTLYYLEAEKLGKQPAPRKLSSVKSKI